MPGPVIGIDLGTSCGWALALDDELRSGTWDLKPVARSCARTRQRVLWERLDELREQHGQPALIAHEEVMAHGRADEREVKCGACGRKTLVRVQATNVLAAHVYAALQGTLALWCDAREVRLESVPVGTLKKFATGDGRAKKDDMVAWARFRWPDQSITTDDQADALHVLDWALVEVLHQKTKPLVVGQHRDGTMPLPGLGPSPVSEAAAEQLPEIEF